MLIAALNRRDRHHTWAVENIVGARASGEPILVPQPVIGEAYTFMRYDRRVSPRRDASVALSVFAMIDNNPDAFREVAAPATAHGQARAILSQYWDHGYSYIDAVILQVVDATPSVTRVLTVDGADFRSYRFGREIDVATPG